MVMDYNHIFMCKSIITRVVMTSQNILILTIDYQSGLRGWGWTFTWSHCGGEGKKEGYINDCTHIHINDKTQVNYNHS